MAIVFHWTRILQDEFQDDLIGRHRSTAIGTLSAKRRGSGRLCYFMLCPARVVPALMQLDFTTWCKMTRFASAMAVCSWIDQRIRPMEQCQQRGGFTLDVCSMD